MPTDRRTILKLRVPVRVEVGRRRMELSEVLDWLPGSIIELPKSADEALDLLVNNKVVGSGVAVKVAENFGIRIRDLDPKADRIRALGPQEPQSGSLEPDADAAQAEA